MSIKINKDKCIGCTRCSKVCPGNLIYMVDGKAEIRYLKDCWSCASCLKECEAGAIELYIPKEANGKGGTISLKKDGETITWNIKYGEKEKKIKTNRLESNKY